MLLCGYMKSNITEAVAPTIEYPRLMAICRSTNSIENGIVILFSSFGKGMVVYCPDGGAYPIGYYSAGWDMVCMEIFSGEVNLSN